ncbi:hypothetical protein PHYBLDRAFT_69047 [Phycomyces blakesleeanus NRRL 1555(-)]|uniref:Uncharacterized protein n=1 Tax=Phycomyces blakesleeanus (strain ATCC 8743b / DSM 1359 / FGSC 10004 / NBRC 33097 / NRRL 1555) TaxID=763407 RepID=A0A167KNE7_PHYB8|nr:hypothetical protein PHYBLDRAFT_69047 [Phycomyces blakesleeanus NRRL 1555(-)]OAD68495.1 hypothetical protein PHYBLDRAFT_69047 [Phycomyces blakesleeanus NRRL 1555(-)]|eukprot:XP_018286535.1 hypothetical protein PHYBLDRAFT_69047 [Phycomyces blakesleeanus NRRL 1555(-)]
MRSLNKFALVSQLIMTISAKYNLDDNTILLDSVSKTILGVGLFLSVSSMSSFSAFTASSLAFLAEPDITLYYLMFFSSKSSQLGTLYYHPLMLMQRRKIS